VTISPGRDVRGSNPSDERGGGSDCEVIRVVTPELVRALDDLCVLAQEMGRVDMAEQCAVWTQQLRLVLGMDAESQKKTLSEIWLG
jgi:hypothetical protein